MTVQINVISLDKCNGICNYFADLSAKKRVLNKKKCKY